MKVRWRTDLALIIVSSLVACTGSSGDGAGDQGTSEPGADIAALDDTKDSREVPSVDVAPEAAETVSDGPSEAVADISSDVMEDAPASPCGPDGFCRSMVMSSCGDPQFVPMPGQACSTDDGQGGYCCVPGGECQNDQDCPDCMLCELTALGVKHCVEPFGSSGVPCTKKSQCPEQYCCSFDLFVNKPHCGGLCVYEGGSENCDNCQDEGAGYYSGDIECCPWLDPVPMTMSVGDEACIPGRALGSMVCVLKCGDGNCTTGEDKCNCPKDCPFSFPGGPGAPCTKDEDCKTDDTGVCLPGSSGYPAGGYCIGGWCDPQDPYHLCPAGSTCTLAAFVSAYLCLPTCRRDEDCREGLTCEAFSELAPMQGGYFCWQTSKDNPKAQLGYALGEACTETNDCISQMCMNHPTAGTKVCSAFCNTDTPCKESQVCHPMAGCGDPLPCGACFTP